MTGPDEPPHQDTSWLATEEADGRGGAAIVVMVLAVAAIVALAIGAIATALGGTR